MKCQTISFIFSGQLSFDIKFLCCFSIQTWAMDKSMYIWLGSVVLKNIGLWVNVNNQAESNDYKINSNLVKKG